MSVTENLLKSHADVNNRYAAQAIKAISYIRHNIKEIGIAQYGEPVV